MVATESFSYRSQPAKNAVGLTFTHDGQLIVATHPEVCAWRVPSLERAYRARPLLKALGRVAVQSHCARIVCGGYRSEFAVLDSDTGETLASYADRERPVALSACGRFAICILRHGWRVRDIETNEVAWERELPGTIVNGISPVDGGNRWALHIHVLPGADDNAARSRVEIWRWPFGSQPERIVGDALLAIDTVAVHRNGAIAINGMPERGRKTLRVYGDGDLPLAEDAAEVMTRLIGWADARHFVSALDDRIEIRSAVTARIACTIEAPGHNRYGVCVAPGGTDLAIGYAQGFVHVRGDFTAHERLRIENPWPKPAATGKRRAPPGADVRYSLPTPSATRTIAASTMLELKAALAELARPVWTPVLRMDEGPVTASKFAGTPSLAPGSHWPRCGRCEDWLQPLLQLNASDLPAELQGLFVGTLQAFFCTTPECAAWDPFTRRAVVRLTTSSATPAFTRPPFPEAFMGRQIVAWERHLDYPAEEELHELGVVLTNGPEMDDEFLSPVDGDKLMGWPGWPHSPGYAKCPKCAGRMRVIVQIGSEQCVPHMFGDGYPAYISQCERHKDVLTFHFG